MGSKERREREKLERREAIIDAAERVFFARGLESTTMQQIADEVELNKATLYLYFKNKDDLFHAIIYRGLKLLCSRLEAAAAKASSGRARTRALMEAFHLFHREHPDLIDAMHHRESPETGGGAGLDALYEQKTDEATTEVFALFTDALRLGMEDGSIRPDLDPLLFALQFWGQASGVLQLVRNKGEVIERVLDVREDALLDSTLDGYERLLAPEGNR